MDLTISSTRATLRLAAILAIFTASLISGCNDGDTGGQGSQGIQGVQGAPGETGAKGLAGDRGPQGVPGPAGPQGVQGVLGAQGIAGATPAAPMVYVIPGSGGVSGGGYLTLNTPSTHAQFIVTCNYGFAGDSEAFWFAGLGVTAGQIEIINRLDGQPMRAFNDLEYNQGGQDRATVGGSTQLSWPWQGVLTVNDGGALSRWDITVTGSAGGDCTAIVYSNNSGVSSIGHP
jgi:Collagen triple helix repeat (20 copies)